MDIESLQIPINRTAALVTNQHGCEDQETEFVRLSRERENLFLSLKSVELALIECEDKKEKKELGAWKFQLQTKMTKVKLRLKELNIQKKATVDHMILQECMQRMSKQEWNEIERIANEKFRKLEEQEYE